MSRNAMAQVNLSNARITVSAGPLDSERRTVYSFAITLPNGARYEASDLRSGVGGGTAREGMRSLLGFLCAAGESHPDGENADLFTPAVCEWAAEYADDLAMQSERFERVAA